MKINGLLYFAPKILLHWLQISLCLTIIRYAHVIIIRYPHVPFTDAATKLYVKAKLYLLHKT